MTGFFFGRFRQVSTTFAGALPARVRFPSAKMPLDQLLSTLPLLKPRIYSVASDARYSPEKVEFTIVINQRLGCCLVFFFVCVCQSGKHYAKVAFYPWAAV